MFILAILIKKMMLTPPRKATVVRRFFFDFRLPHATESGAPSLQLLSSPAPRAASFGLKTVSVKFDSKATG